MWRTYLKEQVAEYELTVLEQNNVSDVISGSEISLAYKDNSQVEDALDAAEPAAVDRASLFRQIRARRLRSKWNMTRAALEERIQRSCRQ